MSRFLWFTVYNVRNVLLENQNSGVTRGGRGGGRTASDDTMQVTPE